MSKDGKGTSRKSEGIPNKFVRATLFMSGHRYYTIASRNICDAVVKLIVEFTEGDLKYESIYIGFT